MPAENKIINQKNRWLELSGDMQQIIASNLNYKDIVETSLVCKRGLFQQNLRDILASSVTVTIPRSLDTHDEWIGFLKQLPKLQASSEKRRELLSHTLYQEIDLGRKKIATYNESKTDFLSPTTIIGIVVIFWRLLQEDHMTSTGLLCLLLLFKKINGKTNQNSSVTPEEIAKKTSLIKTGIERNETWISFFNPSADSKSQFNRSITITREYFLKHGIELDRLCKYEVMRYLLILLNEDKLDQLKFDELNINHRAALIHYCIKFCDVQVGDGFLINRFMELTNMMEWDFNEKYPFRGSVTLLSMVLQYFPTKSETQKLLLKDFLNHLVKKNADPGLEFMTCEFVTVETPVYPYDRTARVPGQKRTHTTINNWLREKSIPKRNSEDPIYPIAEDALRSVTLTLRL